MGTTNEYKCKSCGYLAQVSGHRDAGFMCITETMICNNCMELVDVIIEAQPHAQHLDKFVGLCPNCSTSNVQKWPQDGPCPKCKNEMEQGKLISFWD